MIGRLPLAAAVVVPMFIAGCRTPALHVVPTATIRNDAALAYSFGDTTPFRVASSPVEVIALAPQAYGDDAIARSQFEFAATASRAESVLAASGSTGSTVAAIVVDDARRSDQDAQAARSVVGGTEASSSSADLQVASSAAQASASGSSDASDASAVQDQESNQSTTRERSATASAATLAQKGVTSASDFVGSGHAESRGSDMVQRVGQARLDANSASARADWLAVKPTIAKWATRERVVVGERFDYVVEITNACPLDLVFAEIEDRLDPRLSVMVSAVRTTPRAEVKVDLVDGRLSIRFTEGIRRGQSIAIIIPTVLEGAVAD